MLKTSRPWTVVVSMPCLMTTRSMPRLSQFLGERDHVLEAAHGPAHPGDDESVALAEVGEGLVEFGAGGEFPADPLVGEDALGVAAVGHEFVDLGVVFLFAGGDPRISDLSHATIVR